MKTRPATIKPEQATGDERVFAELAMLLAKEELRRARDPRRWLRVFINMEMQTGGLTSEELLEANHILRILKEPPEGREREGSYQDHARTLAAQIDPRLGPTAAALAVLRALRSYAGNRTWTKAEAAKRNPITPVERAAHAFLNAWPKTELPTDRAIRNWFI